MSNVGISLYGTLYSHPSPPVIEVGITCTTPIVIRDNTRMNEKKPCVI